MILLVTLVQGVQGSCNTLSGADGIITILKFDGTND